MTEAEGAVLESDRHHSVRQVSSTRDDEDKARVSSPGELCLNNNVSADNRLSWARHRVKPEVRMRSSRSLFFLSLELSCVRCLEGTPASNLWSHVPGLLSARLAPSFASVCHHQRLSRALEKREHLQRKPQQRQCSSQPISQSDAAARTPVALCFFRCQFVSVLQHIYMVSSVLVSK